MSSPNENHPLASFVDACHTLVGSLILFWIACMLGYVLTMYDFNGGFSILEISSFWFFLLVGAIIKLIGLPFAAVHFWTLYRFLYTEDPRLKLFFIACATQSVICIFCVWPYAFSDHWLRYFIVAGVLTGVYFTLKKFGLWTEVESI